MADFSKLEATLVQRQEQRRDEAAANRDRFPAAAFLVDEVRRVFGKGGRFISAENNNGETMVHDERMHRLLQDGKRWTPNL